MAFISSVAYSGFSQLPQTTLISTVSSLSANVFKEFFSSVFYYPENNYIPVIIFSGTVIAAGAGIAFLTKLAYDKCFPS